MATKKSISEAYTRLLAAAQQFEMKVRFGLKQIHHSETNVTVKVGDKEGKAIVSVEELIATTKAAELLGYSTQLAVVNQGKTLRLLFVENPANVAVPQEFNPEN